MKQIPISKRRLTFMLLIVSALILLACNLFSSLSQGNEPAAGGAEIPPTRGPIPDGWKLSEDSSGTCQVATPPDWQLEVDFFLAAEEPDPGPFEDVPGQYPPSGLALWGTDDTTQLPEGHFFQIRTSRGGNEQVCSVWRIKADEDFTDAEKSEMEQVGATLQEVQ